LSPDEFKALVLQKSPDDIVRDEILSPGAYAIADDLIEYMRRELSASFNIPIDKIQLFIVGSGKFGFSISRKKEKESGQWLPRYRSFSAESDIDVAVVSQTLYYLIWKELAGYAHGDNEYMFSSEQGAYMLWGWLRPDFFPKYAGLVLSETWWQKFNSFSADTRFGRRKIRGGLYFGRWFLSEYQKRAVVECRNEEELKR
jgi:hypothetical protein